MSTSLSRNAYADCFVLFDRAAASPIGIRYKVLSKGKAVNLRMRMNYARTLDRREAREIYPADDPNHGVSPYDSLIIRIHSDRDGWWIYIEPMRIEGEVEELKAAE